MPVSSVVWALIAGTGTMGRRRSTTECTTFLLSRPHHAGPGCVAGVALETSCRAIPDTAAPPGLTAQSGVA